MNETDTLADKIREFTKLLPDWDSYGAVPVTEVAAKRALELIGQYADIALPRPFPLSTGGVQLEWSTGPLEGRPRLEITIDVESDGRTSFEIRLLACSMYGDLPEDEELLEKWFLPLRVEQLAELLLRSQRLGSISLPKRSFADALQQFADGM